MKKLLLLKHKGGKKLFVQTYVFMMLIRLGLFMLPFRQLQDLISQASRLKVLARLSSNTTISAIVLSVNRSSKYSPGNVKCLARALTTAVLMSIYSFPYKVNIGVAKDKDNNLEAHAWVESQGNAIVGNLPDLSRYVAMSPLGENLII